MSHRAPGFSLSFRCPLVWLALTCLTTILVYLPGLPGPFLFDDISNLSPLGPWIAGNDDWRHVLLGNTSGPFGRPLAMATFMLDAWWAGGAPFSFKVTNLLIHLGCGILIFLLCRSLFERDARLRAQASWWALGIVSIWLLHPIQVSTVLYVVQRMAQLSALFVLIALLCYVHGRTLLESGRLRPAAIWLFVAFPLATLLAALSKENGVLAPLFALVLELCSFRAAHRPRAVVGFFVVFLIVPGLLAAGWYALHPERILAGYEIRDFTLGERLLTEPRVLVDYVRSLLLPGGAALGLYGDDFRLSHGLLTPVSTLLAIVFWIVAAFCAWLLRLRSPMFCAGVFIFLAGHVMESTVFALEIHFEHRNYLPSLGAFMALGGLVQMGYAQLRVYPDKGRLARVAAVLIVLALAVATHMRAWSWQSWPVLVTQAAAAHPDSMRAQMDMAALYIKSGQYDQARAMFAGLRGNASRTAQNVGAIYPVVLDCQVEGMTNDAHLDDLRAIGGKRLGHYEAQALEMLAKQLGAAPCQGLSNNELAALLANLASEGSQQKSHAVGKLHHMAADFYNRTGDLARAREQAQAAWATGEVDISAGRLLATLLIASGDYEAAERVTMEMRERVSAYDVRGREMTAALAEQLRAAKHNANLHH